MLRVVYALAAGFTIGAGLLSRQPGLLAWMRTYAAAALHAVMMPCRGRAPWPMRRETPPAALPACWLEELSPLWHSAWLAAIRRGR